MHDSSTTELLVSLADRQARKQLARELARRVGAEALFVFVYDRELSDTLVPAPGFAPVVPGGSSWRAALRTCASAGLHELTVGYPSADNLCPALALADRDIVFIFAGGSVDRAAPALQTLRTLARLIAAMLQAENGESIVNGELRVAREAARQAVSLARALDVTRLELERTLAHAERQAESVRLSQLRAEEAARVKDEFLAMLGHELRNPLSPIVTALHLAKMKGVASRELQIIERHVAHLTRLLDDLLDVARVTQGKIQLQKEVVELAPIALRAIEMASPLLEQKRQNLTVQVPTQGLTVHADPARLAQVLSNLLTNASRYSAPERSVVLSAAREGEQVVIRVRDEGRGIEPDMLEVIFDPFVQAKQSSDRAQGGLGLGLAIVRSLVTLLGGVVYARSAGKDRGSELTVELPACDALVFSTAKAEPSELLAMANGERVLVVDDNEDAAELLAESLRELSYDVRTAHDGVSALEIARSFAPELAVLDIGLPVMDGYELAQHLKALPDQRDLGLIALTGYGQESDREKARAAGFSAHFVKPVNLPLVLGEVRSLLAERRAVAAGREFLRKQPLPDAAEATRVDPEQAASEAPQQYVR